MGGLLLRLRTWWETADRTQRVVTIFGGAFLVILLMGTFYFASKPKMELAFSGLSMTELGAVTEEIKKQGVPVEFDQSGNVLMPKDKIAQVKASLAVANKLPMGGAGKAGSLKDIGAFSTPDVEKSQLKAILESEVADTIAFVDGVQSARVKITAGDSSPFANEEKPATASVAIIEKSGQQLNGEQSRAIARLVAYAVPGLDINHVSIVNQAGALLFDGESQMSANGVADTKITAEINESKRRERELQSMLDSVYGAGATVAKVSVTLNFDQKSTKTTTPLVSKKPVVDISGTEVMDGGPTANGVGTPRTPDPTKPTSKKYDGSKNTKEYAQGTNVETTETAIGAVTGMKVTVAVNKDKSLVVADVQKMAEKFSAQGDRPQCARSSIRSSRHGSPIRHLHAKGRRQSRRVKRDERKDPARSVDSPCDRVGRRWPDRG